MTDLVRLEQSMLPARLSAAFAIPVQGQESSVLPTSQAGNVQRGALQPAGTLHHSGATWPPMGPQLQAHTLQAGVPAWQGAFGLPQGYCSAPDPMAAATAAAAAQAAAHRAAGTAQQAPGATFVMGHPQAGGAIAGVSSDMQEVLGRIISVAPKELFVGLWPCTC